MSDSRRLDDWQIATALGEIKAQITYIIAGNVERSKIIDEMDHKLDTTAEQVHIIKHELSNAAQKIEAIGQEQQRMAPDLAAITALRKSGWKWFAGVVVACGAIIHWSNELWQIAKNLLANK